MNGGLHKPLRLRVWLSRSIQSWHECLACKEENEKWNMKMKMKMKMKMRMKIKNDLKPFKVKL
jgi:hypothetical protein